MKRLKSSDDLNSYGGEKGVFKDWGRKDDDSSLHQSSSHRSFHYKSESGKKGLSSSSSRYERSDDDRKNSRLIRKRSDYDVDSYERRKSYDRYRDSSERGILSSSPRGGSYGGERIHRSESFSGPRRDFPKGFRSERDRSRREGSVSSWRRFGSGKEAEEGAKSGSDSARGSKAASEEMANVRSPHGRDAKSPPWSKDSESEQSKSVEVKKSESLPAESGNNSEREEGELEPEPETEPAPIAEKSSEDKSKLKSTEEIKPNETCIFVEKAEVKEPESQALQNVTNKDNNKSSTSEDSSTQRTGENRVEVPISSVNEKKDADHEDEAKDVSGSSKLEEIKPKEVKATVLEVKAENVITVMDEEVTRNVEEHVASGVVNHFLVTKELTQSFKDKGKSVIVSDSNGDDFMENNRIDTEGPSIRGFDLFFTDPVKKPENIDQKGTTSKPKDEKLSLEPLELSLRLPNVLLPIGAPVPLQTPDSPSQDMSMQSMASSFQTSSDGFTRSFSGSQHYTHNPSCSLTETSFDFEQSVGSRPLFQGVNWQQIQPSDEPKNVPNGNGTFHQTQGVSNVQFNSTKVAEASYKLPLGLERQLSSNNTNNNITINNNNISNQPSGSHSRHRNEIRSPTQSVGSHDTFSDHHKDQKRHRGIIGNSSKTVTKDEKTVSEIVEPLLIMVVSEPLHIVTRIFNEMTAQSLTSLKDSVREIISNPNKRRQHHAFRKTLEKRSDFTLESLSKSNISQLEIMVSLKTGLKDFLQTNPDTTLLNLAEIFLNLKCRNLACRNYLPVDECDCKICVQKMGFCSACMCLICSKFDMASNTCSWVGCDVCLHWCHTDCGLKESFIRNGRSASGVLGQTEMQFHCVACDHPSEMFGFVREVFQNFAKGWSAESLLNELEYVRRIFSRSEDIRGKRLHEICIQLLTRLSNKSDVHQVRSYIMSFFTDDNDAFKSDNIQITQEKEASKQNLGERSNNNTDVSKSNQEATMWMKSVYTDKPLQFKPATSDIQRAPPPIQREPVFDELDGIVRIKLAEAQMFQMRADDARREAEGLNRIAKAKSKKIDEEFNIRVNKLHLNEAEEIRRQKFEELQSLENAHQEYFNMKVRMEREIKDLLVKMEATKRNFTS